MPAATLSPPSEDLTARILGGVTRASPEEEAALFETHPYYGEVEGNKFYVNEARLEKEGSTEGVAADMHFGEALHRLRDTAPEWHSRLRTAAAADPAVQQWKRDSYAHAQRENNETRPIDEWWDESRFDQVVGGFLLGGPDASIPTLRSWDREQLPFGMKFRQELENFETALGRAPSSEQPSPSLGAMPVNPRWGDARARHPNRLIHAADALRSAQDFGNKAQIPYLGGVGDLLVGGAQDVAERLAYGDRITTGKGQTQQLHPGTVDLASLAYLPAKAVTASAGLGADLAAGFAKKILAGGSRRGAPVDLGRRSALKNIGTAAIAAPVLATGAKVVDEMLTPAAKATAKATAAPVAKGGLNASKAADSLLAEWNAHWADAFEDFLPVGDNVLGSAEQMKGAIKAMATSLEKIIAKYPNAVLDKDALLRFDLRGARRKGRMFVDNPNFNAYERMGLKSRPSGTVIEAQHAADPATEAKMRAVREFLDELEQKFRDNLKPNDVAGSRASGAEAQALVERWQATGKWGTHTPDGTRIPDGVDMDYFDVEDWMQRYEHDWGLPHEDAFTEMLLRDEMGYTPKRIEETLHPKPRNMPSLSEMPDQYKPVPLSQEQIKQGNTYLTKRTPQQRAAWDFLGGDVFDLPRKGSSVK